MKISKEIPLTHNKFAIVDDDDYEWLSQWKWRYHKYACREECIDNKTITIFMHRVINNTPNGMFTDHINCNKLDNRKQNLRDCNREQNGRNRGKNKGEFTSEFKGVHFHKATKMYIANIRFNDKNYNLLFSSEIAAANIYNHLAKVIYGKFALLNDVEYMSLDECMKYRVSKGRSKYHGVTKSHNKYKKWRVNINYQGHQIYIGSFENEEDAARAYNKKSIELYGYNASLNLIIGGEVINIEMDAEEAKNKI